MSDPTDAQRLPLHEKHRTMEARMGTVAGWSVTMSYIGPLEESALAQTSGAVCDVPYLSRIRLRGDEKLSVGDAGSGNLLALKALLPYYAGQIKCIYIEPPYNTGNENWGWSLRGGGATRL